MSTVDQETRFSLLTSPGRGAIASLLVEGPLTTDAVGRLFRHVSGRPVSSLPLHRVMFGAWSHQGQGATTTEEVVVVRTGSDRIEINCHGGRAAIESISASLEQLGCTRSTWQQRLAAQWPTTVNEAQLALPYAQTERTATILLDQLRGANTRAARRVVALARAQQLDLARQCVQSILSTGEIGQHLTRPWRVVIAGPANAGKSTLVNAILGFERAIVFDQPGTTRDVLTATTAIDGWPIQLADTAGVRRTSDSIETQGIALARQAMHNADLVLLLFDATETLSDEHQEVVHEYPQAVVLRNKCDLSPAAWPRQYDSSDISALHGTGLKRLLRLIADRLVTDPPSPGAAVITTPRQATIYTRMNDLLSVDPEKGDGLSRLEMLAEELG